MARNKKEAKYVQRTYIRRVIGFSLIGFVIFYFGATIVMLFMMQDKHIDEFLTFS